MHVADIDGRIHDRKKRERQRELVYAGWRTLPAEEDRELMAKITVRPETER